MYDYRPNNKTPLTPITTINLLYLTVRLRAQDFVCVIVDEGTAWVIHCIQIKSKKSNCLSINLLVVQNYKSFKTLSEFSAQTLGKCWNHAQIVLLSKCTQKISISRINCLGIILNHLLAKSRYHYILLQLRTSFHHVISKIYGFRGLSFLW